LRVKKLGNLCDVSCGLALSADVLRAAAIAFFFGQPGTLSVAKVAQLRLEQAASGAILVEGRGRRHGDPD
jgi:hypothetical protein